MATTTTTELTGLSKLQAMAQADGKFVYMEGGVIKDFPLAMLVAELGKGGVSLETLGKGNSLGLLGQIQSVKDLRATKPTKDGERVSLRGWNEGSCLGGGEFIGRLNVQAKDLRKDDGGIIFTSGKDWYWERVVQDVQDLNVLHFGAKQGSTADVDCQAAVLAMFNWSQAQGGYLPVRFPAGNFFLSKFEKTTAFARLRVCGTGNAYFGYFGTTTLYSNTDADVVFNVKARWVEISNIIFDGRSTAIAPNTKGFYKNIQDGGQYLRISCVRWTQVGGNCVDILDALDTKIDQWYASKCSGDVIKGYWSDREAGGWNHMTAVELTNFNVQSCTLGKVLNLPRCTQSFIYNGWIEHSDNPGDLSNGGWIIDGLQIEDCKGSPLKLTYARLINKAMGLQSGSSVSYAVEEGDVEWLSVWERGRVDIQNHGVFIDGTLDVGIIGSRNKISNNTAKAKWFCIGKFYTPKHGDSWDINMVGCGNSLSKGAVLDDVDGVRQGGGNTLLRFQGLNSGGGGGTMTPMGSSPVQAAKCVVSGANYFTIYVQLKPYTFNTIPLVTATGLTHFEAGISVFWRPDCTEVADDVMDTLSKNDDTKDVLEQWSIGAAAGIGVTNEGDLMLKGKVVNNHLQVKVGKQVRYIQLKTEAK